VEGHRLHYVHDLMLHSDRRGTRARYQAFPPSSISEEAGLSFTLSRRTHRTWIDRYFSSTSFIHDAAFEEESLSR